MNDITSPYGDTVRLPAMQESERTEQVRMTVNHPIGPPDQAITTSLASQRSFMGRGVVSGMQLTEFSDYSDDPLIACAEWYDYFHRLANGAQADGNEYYNSDRNEIYTVAIKSLATTRLSGQPFSLNYQFEFVEGDITLPDEDSDPYPDRPISPDHQSTIAGIDLGTILERNDETTTEFTVNPPADQDADPSNTKVYRGSEDSAAVRRITIRGRVTQDKNQFDSDIEDIAGDGNTHTFSTAFPGYDLNVMVGEEFMSKRVSGQKRMTEYTLELTEGQKV